MELLKIYSELEKFLKTFQFNNLRTCTPALRPQIEPCQKLFQAPVHLHPRTPNQSYINLRLVPSIFNDNGNIYSKLVGDETLALSLADTQQNLAIHKCG